MNFLLLTSTSKKMITKKLLPVLVLLFNFSFVSVRAQDASSSQKSKQDHYLKPAALAVPGSFLIYGGLKAWVPGISTIDNHIKANVEQNHGGFHTNAADYLMWLPSASIYAMDALHVPLRHNFKEHLLLDAGSIVITGGLGYGMRLLTRNNKTFNSNGTKFPSGHTANAFRGAELLHQELKETNPILSYSGYVVAAGVGALRIYDKDHLLSEVIAGAGLGILSAKLTYWIFYRVK